MQAGGELSLKLIEEYSTIPDSQYSTELLTLWQCPFTTAPSLATKRAKV